jgi:hypothetical protein
MEQPTITQYGLSTRKLRTSALAVKRDKRIAGNAITKTI